ncbi:unnamed protein product [Rotaria sp. Silwood2]|nr:unnamed protein product [Rotaria sp. Silwood2]CAF4117224.1 unnamed protein product [Rotaria sp. Silwood2]
MSIHTHNGNLFDFPILFNEIKSALSSPSFYANTTTNHNNGHNECISETNTTDSNDNISLASLTTKDSSIQTITTSYDYNETSLLSVACADSLVFFREMHRLLNDKDIVQYPIENISSESPVRSNQNDCQNNVSVNSNELTSTNNNSSARLGYVEIPIKYVPSQDPTRQQLSMKLSKIYEREFIQKTSNLKAHRAEDDCLMLLAILKRYLPDWLEWIELNHQSLSKFFSLPFTSTKQTLPKLTENTKRPLKF